MKPEHSVAYLLNLGLLDRDVLVGQGVQVHEVASRNYNLRIEIGSGLGYCLKQAPPDEPDFGRSLAAEAALYAARLLPGLPRLVHYDPAGAILLLELVRSVPGSDPMSAERLPALADLLAACHRITPADWPPPAGSDSLPRDAPWIFDLARPSPGSLRELAPAQLSLLKAVQTEAQLESILAELRDEWTADCLIHGDLKANNLIACPERVVLVDWELVQWGDPGWDVGGVLQAVITEGVLSLDLPAAATPFQAMESLGAMIATRRPDLAAFSEGYCTARRLGKQDRSRFRDRLSRHTGLRLIKTAYEWCQSEVRMPGRAAAVLQLGLNMLLQPEQANRTVLGLS